MEARVDTSSKLLQRAVPPPASGHVFKAKPATDSFKSLEERKDKLAHALDAGLKASEGPMKDLLARVKAAYEAMPAKLNVDVEAAAYRLMAPPPEWRHDHMGEHFARYWLAKEGGEFALRALAKAGTLSRDTNEPNQWSEPKALTLREEPHDDTVTWGKTDDVWVPIREWVASLDAAEVARLRGMVGKLRADLKPSMRAVLDAALGDPELCAEDAGALTATPTGQTLLVLWPALFSMTDVASLTAIVDKLAGHFTTAIDQLPNLVARLGAEAGPILLRIQDSTLKVASGSERIRDVGAALALVRTPEVTEAMVGYLGVKDLRAIATEYLQGVPELALAPLAAHAVGKGAAADLARTVLGGVVAKMPNEARKVAAGLADAQRAVIEAAIDRFSNVVEADPADLPPVLAKPPWLEKRKAKPPRTVSGLSPLPHTARVVWKSEADRTEAKNERSYYAPEPRDREGDAQGDRGGDQGGQGGARWEATSILQLPKESSLHVVETAPLEIFSWYYKGNVPRALIARYELDALKAVRRYAEIDPTNALEALAVFDAAEVAPLMADAILRLKKSRAEAQAWLLRFPEAAAIGLIPNAVGDHAGSRPPAMGALRWLAAHGKRDVVEKVADRYGAEARAAVDDVLDFDPLLDLPNKMPKLPGFFNAAALPRPRLTGQKKVLPVSAVEAIGTMLAFARIGEPYAGIGQVKQACEPASLAELAFELFQSWLVAGAPSKEQWAFLAVGHLGDDECARKLTPLIRAWPGESAHARAVTGLDVLARIGTDVSLLHLHGIAQKVKFKGLQQKAREKIDQIAEARGLTAAELGDRLVPDLGLDDDGSLLLDFGHRKFRVTFDETLKPAVLDESGKRSSDLPKPNKSDDPEKSAAAVATWKALKKDAKTVASSQLLRLELAMCAQRRWEPEAFDQFFVQHPLLVHLVRRLVWGAFDAKDNLLGTFRVGEDRSYADAKDAAFTPPPGSKIGLVHPLQLDRADADAWGQVLGDYEIMQPFAQLSREAITPTTEEHDTTELGRVTGITVPTGKVLGLDARGWRRGPPQDGGVVCWYEKPLDGTWVAVLDLEPGIFTGMIAESPEQKLGKLVVAKDADSWRKENLRKLGELSPIQFSELVRDLESIRP